MHNLIRASNPAQNFLLYSLPSPERERLFPHLQPVTFSLGQSVCEPGERSDYCYFPTSCCGFTFQLYAQDKTRSDAGGPGNCDWAYSSPWAVCICNDLPVIES